MPWDMRAGQRAHGGWLSFSAMWVPRTKFQVSGLVGSASLPTPPSQQPWTRYLSIILQASPRCDSKVPFPSFRTEILYPVDTSSISISSPNPQQAPFIQIAWKNNIFCLFY